MQKWKDCCLSEASFNLSEIFCLLFYRLKKVRARPA